MKIFEALQNDMSTSFKKGKARQMNPKLGH